MNDKSNATGVKQILFMGDTTLNTAASYLAGVMADGDIQFDYLPSDQSVRETVIDGRQLYIVSDYPASQMSRTNQQSIVDAVSAGAGLLMIGGWESYTGLGGDWASTKLAEILPVIISPDDDRVNYDQAAVVKLATGHEITADLPFDDLPPSIGGFNRTTSKPDATTILQIVRHRVKRSGDSFTFDPIATDPLLVVNDFGLGHVAALMTDAAPHWVGPLVDWGTDHTDPKSGRVSAQGPGANEVEVGCHYARFIQQLLQWTGNL